MDPSLSLKLSICIGVVVGSITAYLAYRRGRHPLFWFVIGFLLGLIGLIILFILPDNKNSTASAPHDKQNSPASENPNVSAESAPHIETLTEEVIDEPSELHAESLDTLPKYWKRQEWFYLDLKQVQKGPVNFDTLKSQWQQQQCTALSYFWTDGWTAWHRIEEYPEVIEQLQT